MTIPVLSNRSGQAGWNVARLFVLVASLLLLSSAIANAACNPTNAPPGSPGCQPVVSSSLATDTVTIWQPASFPASYNQIVAGNLQVTASGQTKSLSAWMALVNGGVVGPGSSTNGFIPQWSGTSGNALSAGLPVGTTGNSTVVLTTSNGLLTPSILPIATTGSLGGIMPDGVTIVVNGSGVASAIGSAASSITVGTTTIGGGTPGHILLNNGGTLGDVATSGSGSVVLATGSTLSGATLGGTTTLSSITGSTQCLHVSTGGVISGTGSDCGSGGGGSGGPVSVRLDSPSTATTTGTGYSQGDILTLLAGCSTGNPKIVVASVSGGAVANFNYTVQGSCTTAPTGALSVTGGTGTGATFTPLWAQQAASVFGPQNAQSNQGNMWIGSIPQAGYTGTESLFIGPVAGGNILSGNFITAVGLNSCGVGAGTTLTGVGSAVCVGTDAGRNIGQGASLFVIVGTGDCPNLATNKVTCIGPATGAAMIDATQSVLIAGGGSLAHGGSDVIIGDAADITGTAATGGAVTATVSGSAVSALAVTAGGSGYVTGSYALAFSGGGGSGAAGFYTVNASGVVASATVSAGGTGYTSAPTVTLPIGNVTGAVVLGQGAKGGTASVIIGQGAGNTGMLGIHVTAVGYQVASVSCQGSQLLLLGTNNSTGCTSTSESSSIHIGAGGADLWWSTGTATASTSVTTLTTQLVMAGATGGAQGPGTINAPGLFINGVAVAASGTLIGFADNSSNTPTTGGSGYVQGDDLILVDGCSTHGHLGAIVTSGVVTGYNITRRGSCSAAPTNPLVTSDVTSGGTGATFTLNVAPLASGLIYNIGGTTNVFLNNGPALGFAGSNMTFAGLGSGAQIIGGAGDTIVGWQGCASASSTPAIISNITCEGANSGRLLSGANTGSIDLFGSGVMNLQALSISGVTAFGTGSLANNNVNALPASLYAFGTSSCSGATGAAFSNGGCFGPNTGGAMLSTGNFLILGRSTGNTWANGTDVILVGDGDHSVEPPSGTFSHYLSFNNVITATGTGTPSTSVTTIAGLMNVTSITYAQGGQRAARRTIASGATDTATTADIFVDWKSSTSSAKTETIPACASGIDGMVLYVSDETGDASTNLIAVTPTSGTINGTGNTVYNINSAHASMQAHCDASNTNWVIN